MRQGSISSEPLMCGGVCAVFCYCLLRLDNRCMYIAQVCFYACCSDSGWVCGNVSCVATIVTDSGF